MDRLTWDEWVDWLAYWDLEPWGESRADERAAAGVCYQLAPYMPEGSELPQLAYPYFEGTAPPTADEIKAIEENIRAHNERWAEWERTRPRATAKR